MNSNTSGEHKDKIRDIAINLNRFSKAFNYKKTDVMSNYFQADELSRQLIEYIEKEPILVQIEKDLIKEEFDFEKILSGKKEPVFNVIGKQRESFALQMMKEVGKNNRPGSYFWGACFGFGLLPGLKPLEGIIVLNEKYFQPLIRYFMEKLILQRNSPLELRIEDIDCFVRVRELSYADCAKYMPKDQLENDIQIALEKIIEEPFHQEDCGGEINDIYTDRIKVNGQWRRTAFMLKGRGTSGRLTIKKCGKNGDQIQRLFRSTVDLFVVQHVDYIDETVINEMFQKTLLLRKTTNPEAQFCIIDGVNTGRILLAYGFLEEQMSEGQRISHIKVSMETDKGNEEG